MKKQTIALSIALCAASIINAQNFSGHYTLQSKEMVDGKEYLNAIAKEITIAQTKDSFKITRITPSSGDQTTTSTESFAWNGKSLVTTTSSKRKKTSTINFDKSTNTATITYVLSYAEKPDEVEYKNTEIWNFGADGTLTITKTSDATVTDDWTIKAVFKKD
jgi:hypothetical protein